MYQIVVLYSGAGLTFGWRLAHPFPTGAGVRGLSDISEDNRHIFRREWITEGVAWIFIGLLVATVTFVDPLAALSGAVYLLSAACLLALAIVSILTGFRVHFLPYRLCPLIFSLSAVLMVIGAM